MSRYSRRSMRQAGFIAAGSVLSLTVFFSAQMFAQPPTLYEPAPVRPVRLPETHPLLLPVETEATLPAEPFAIQLGMPGGIDHNLDSILTQLHTIGWQRFIPDNPLIVQRFGPNEVVLPDRHDLWVPPGRYLRPEDSEIDAVRPLAPWHNDDGFHDSNPGGGPEPPRPPDVDPPVHIPEPGALSWLIALPHLLTRRRHHFS